MISVRKRCAIKCAYPIVNDVLRNDNVVKGIVGKTDSVDVSVLIDNAS